MMKKVLYGVALALAACGPVCTLQSCKDDVSDLKTQTSFDLAELRKDLNDQAYKLQQQINANRDAIWQNKGDIQALAASLKDYATVEYVNGQLQDLIDLIAPQLSDMQGSINGINDKLALTANQIAALEQNDQKLLAAIVDNVAKIKDLEGKYDALKEVTDQHADAIENLKFRVTEAVKAINLINEELDKLKPRVDALEGDVDQIKKDIAYMQENLAALNETVSALRQDVYELTGRVEDLETRMDAVENALNLLTDRMDNFISSILIQRAVSPVFGDLSLPIGIKSNILFNWYGYNDIGDAYDFPNAGSEYDANGIAAGVEFKTPKNGYAQIGAGYFEDKVYLGDVYVTLNPIGANFNGTPLTFTTSAGNKLDCVVEIEASDDELMHGYTRGEAGEIESGLYKGSVYVKSEAAEGGDAELKQVAVNISDKLRDSMKDALKNPTKHNAAALVKAVYDQLNGILPAYALRYDWTSTNGLDLADPEYSAKSNAVLSQYDLAVATARPLGFNFLNDFGGSNKKVPTISNVDNFISQLIEDNLNFNFESKPIEIAGVPVAFVKPEGDLENIDFVTHEYNYEYYSYTTLEVIINGLKVGDEVLEPLSTGEFWYASDASWLINRLIKENVKNALEDLGIEYTKAVEAEIDVKIDLVLLQMQQQISQVVDEISGQIDQAFDNVGNKADNYLNKVNRAIDLYNKVANKVNNFLKNPNHYLQACAFYEANSNMGILSGSVKSPTQFNAAGGNAINVFLSTYTGELIAPAFKKYVAVTGVYDKDGKALNEDVSSLNSGNLNTVLDGKDIRVVVPVSGFDSNKVYEFTYQAIDYRGFTSTYKFYVKVNK